MSFTQLRVPVGPAKQAKARRSSRRRLTALFAVALTCVGLGMAYALVGGWRSPVVPPPATAAARPTGAQIANAVFIRLNNERAMNHLPVLRRNARLNSSARMHNMAMTRANLMSHQGPGEASLGARISHFGYRWRAAAENVGWSSDKSIKGGVALEIMMYYEKPPNNGHRLNILSRTSRDIGVDIVIDVGHNNKMWLTEDFGTPA